MTKTIEEVFSKLLTPEQRTRAAERGAQLVEQYKTLQHLRKARDMTQVQLARVLGKEQAEISQLEKRSDMLLSTLRSYVEAMGGSLNLVIQFDDQDPVFLTGIADDEPSATPRPVARARSKQPSPL